MVAELPDKDAKDTGLPFNGSLGRLFDKELELAGLSRAKVAIIYAAACNPDIKMTESTVRKAVQACQPLFWARVALLAPDVPVLAMGRWAHFALTGKSSGVLKSRGFIRQEYRLVSPPTTQKDDPRHDSSGSAPECPD